MKNIAILGFLILLTAQSRASVEYDLNLNKGPLKLLIYKVELEGLDS